MSTSPEHLHVSFQDAFNRHDLDAIVALYEPEAVLVTGGRPVQGTAAIRDAYRGILALQPTIALQTLRVNRAGDLAQLHGRWTMDRAGQTGEDARSEGRNTETARQQPDGRWLFVIDDPLTTDRE